MNTPETPLFHKGELLYGHALARTAAKDGAPIVLTEGYMDVIALAQAGFTGAVGTLGTAVTESQLGALWRLCDVPVICLDGDRAGIEAAYRLLDRALPLLRPGKSLRFAVLPPGEDPDSLIRAQGRDAIDRVLDAAIHLVDFLFQREMRGADLASPERRAAMDQRFRELGRAIQDRDCSRHVVGALFERLRKVRGAARASGGPGRSGRFLQPAPNAAAAGVGSNRLAQSLARRARGPGNDLLGPILDRPELLSLIEEDLAGLEFADRELDSLREEILSWYCAVSDLEAEALRDHLAQVGRGALADSFRSEERISRGSANPVTLEAAAERWRKVRDHYRSHEVDLARARLEDAITRGETEFGVHIVDADALLNPGRGRRSGPIANGPAKASSPNDPEFPAPAASTVSGRGT